MPKAELKIRQDYGNDGNEILLWAIPLFPANPSQIHVKSATEDRSSVLIEDIRDVYNLL